MKKVLVGLFLVCSALAVSSTARATWTFGGYCGQFSHNSSTDPWTGFFSTATIPSNSVGILAIAIDNDGAGVDTDDITATTATDTTAENIFNVDGENEVDPGAGAAGAFVGVAWKHFTSTMSLQAGATWWVNMNAAKIAKGAVCMWFNVAAGDGTQVIISSAGTVQKADDSGDASALQMTGLDLGNYLFLRFTASESTSAAQSVTSSGWVATSTAGHNSGTNSSSMGIGGEYLIATSTTQSTVSDPTMQVITSIDRASSLIALKETVLSLSSPTISNATGTMSGTWSDGNVLTVTGSDFGTRTVLKPVAVGNYEGNTSSPSATLGQVSEYTVMENMTACSDFSFDGSYALCSTPGWENTIARFRQTIVPDDTVGRGDWWFYYMKRKVTYPYEDANLKWIRLWDTNGTSGSGSQYPNMYWSTQGATKNSRLISLEIVPDTSKTKGVTGLYRHPAETPSQGWRTEMYLVQMNSAIAAVDGKAYSYLWIPSSGSYFASSTTWQTDSTNAPGLYDEISPEDDPSSITMTGNVYWDMTVVDISTNGFPAMALLSDAATFESGNVNNVNVNYLVPKSWANDALELYISTAGFSAGQTVYLYIFNSEGKYNETGFPLQMPPAVVVEDTTPAYSPDFGVGSSFRVNTPSLSAWGTKPVLRSWGTR